jgi:hypothetical protein
LTPAEISPAVIGEERIRLTVSATQGPIVADAAVSLDVDYAQALPQGVTLPLELIIQGPTLDGYQRRAFRRSAPSSIVVVPRESGQHQITLREAAHNRWWGALQFYVEGI